MSIMDDEPRHRAQGLRRTKPANPSKVPSQKRQAERPAAELRGPGRVCWATSICMTRMRNGIGVDHDADIRGQLRQADGQSALRSQPVVTTLPSGRQTMNLSTSSVY